jgi:hypothetical protein
MIFVYFYIPRTRENVIYEPLSRMAAQGLVELDLCLRASVVARILGALGQVGKCTMVVLGPNSGHFAGGVGLVVV